MEKESIMIYLVSIVAVVGIVAMVMSATSLGKVKSVSGLRVGEDSVGQAILPTDGEEESGSNNYDCATGGSGCTSPQTTCDCDEEATEEGIVDCSCYQRGSEGINRMCSYIYCN